MNDETLDAIEARANAATDGPWWAWNRGVGYVIAVGEPGDIDQDERPDQELPEGMRTDIGRREDATFIAATRTDVPALVAEVRRLRAEREHMELHPTGTVDWLKNRVNELTAEVEQLTAYNRAVKGANDDLRAAAVNRDKEHQQ